MKKIIRITAILALLGAALSCSKEFRGTDAPGADELRLELFCLAPETKAAADPQAGTGNENRVTKIDYFFFEDETSAPLWSDTYKPETTSATSYTISIKPGVDGVPAVEELFPDRKAIFFAVANYTGELSDKTLTQIKNLAIEKTYGTEAEMTGTSGTQHFIMTAQQEIEPKVQTASIPLRRIAAKVSLTVNLNAVTTTGDDETTTWTPIWSVARVRLENEATNGLLGAGEAYADGEQTKYYLPTDLGLDNTDYLNYTEDLHTLSFYTLPNRWEVGAPDEPALKFIVRWEVETKNASGDVVYKGITDERYYKIMLPGTLTSFDANCWYKLTATVGVNASEKEPLIALEGFTVLKWSSPGDVVSANILNAKYISPERANTSFYGTSSTVAYAATGPVTMTVKDIYQVRFTNNGETPFYLIQDGVANETNIASMKDASGTDLTEAMVRAWVSGGDTEGELGGTVTVDHTLCSDFTKKYFDATPYVYVVTLHLTDETGTAYDKTVTLRQIPNFTLEQIESNGKVFINGTAQPTNNNTRNTTSNNRFLNFYYNSSYWGKTEYNNNDTGQLVSASQAMSGDSENKSKYMYLVSAAISDDYSVMDPRGTSPDALVNNALNNLSGYRSARDIDAVAPLFIIASSYGKTSFLPYNAAKTRCAAYQEAGYPAGRWRLPTEKEIEFLITLRKNGLIAELFSNDYTYDGSDRHGAGYWASSGRYYFYGKDDFSEFKYSNDNTYTASFDWRGDLEAIVEDGYIVGYRTNCYFEYTRCIYDAWYWGVEPLDNDGKKVTKEAGNEPATNWLTYEYANKISN